MVSGGQDRKAQSCRRRCLDRRHRLQARRTLRPKHPINADEDILGAASGWGIDTYGSGKYGGVPEVLITRRDGRVRKAMTDMSYGIAGWLNYMAANGITAPELSYNRRPA